MITSASTNGTSLLQQILSWDLSALSLENARQCLAPPELVHIITHRMLSHPVAVARTGTISTVTLSGAGKLKVSDTAAVPVEFNVDGVSVLSSGCCGRQRVAIVLQVRQRSVKMRGLHRRAAFLPLTCIILQIPGQTSRVLLYGVEVATGNLELLKTFEVDTSNTTSITRSRAGGVYFLGARNETYIRWECRLPGKFICISASSAHRQRRHAARVGHDGQHRAAPRPL